MSAIFSVIAFVQEKNEELDTEAWWVLAQVRTLKAMRN